MVYERLNTVNLRAYLHQKYHNADDNLAISNADDHAVTVPNSYEYKTLKCSKVVYRLRYKPQRAFNHNHLVSPKRVAFHRPCV